LIKAGLVKVGESKYGVKILGGGEVDKSLKFVGCEMTAPVKEAIIKAGGSVN
jgi:ribosomal protein L15